jgi:hypothetical protein
MLSVLARFFRLTSEIWIRLTYNTTKLIAKIHSATNIVSKYLGRRRDRVGSLSSSIFIFRSRPYTLVTDSKKIAELPTQRVMATSASSAPAPAAAPPSPFSDDDATSDSDEFVFSPPPSRPPPRFSMMIPSARSAMMLRPPSDAWGEIS